MRITRVRVAVQAVMFGLFLLFVFITQSSTLRGFPVSLFLEVDPLVGLSTTFATGRVYQGLLAALVILLPTLFLGRFFCNWICPMGTLMQFTGWLFDRRSDAQRMAANSYRPAQYLKYLGLAFLLVAALFGSAQNGWLDPIPTLHRSFTTAVVPVVNKATGLGYARPHEHQYAWLIGGFLLTLMALATIWPRFFCRVLCPLGALLGWFAKFAVWRIYRDPDVCIDCDNCLVSCQGACDPARTLRQAECFVCFNCLDECPTGALSYRPVPPPQNVVPGPDVERRKVLAAAGAGALFVALARVSGDLTRNFSPKVVRPPGAVAEPEFLARCIKCDQCIRVCPTNVLQPALFEAGVEGLFTPVMNFRMGYCELNCTLCGQVCPTGAIQRISIAQKQGGGEFAAAGPIRSGTAFYNRGRCLPWAMDTPCVVCEEVCPVSPKAIFTRTVEIEDRWGRPVTLKQPHVDPNLCIGCGICEHECPVVDEPAVYVTAVGETRSKERSLLLGAGEVTGS